MKSYISLSVFTCLLFFSLTGIVAQESTAQIYFQPIQDVFKTELVYPQEEGEVQLTFNPAFGQGSDVNCLYFPFLAEYGLTIRLNNWIF